MKKYYFDEIDSTQDYAKELCNKGQNNFVVFAKSQILGRGRSGRRWESPNGGLWFSFDMEFKDKKLFTLGIGVAVCEVLEEIYKTEIKLKWPNDIILNKKKVGGIICEKIKNKVVVGIGINTNVDFIKEKNATTFSSEIGIIKDNEDVMLKIINRCNEIEENKIIEKFRRNMAYKGENRFISSIGKEAKILDVSDTGRLIVEIDGEINEIFSGEIICI